MTEIINENVEKIQDVAKVQRIGKGKNGKDRYMIYVTNAVREGNLKPGDKVVFSLYKITYEEQKERNTETKVGIPKEIEQPTIFIKNDILPK